MKYSRIITLISSVLILCAFFLGCTQYGSYYRHIKTFNSHDEFIDFLNVYNDTGRTFLSLDFDSCESINKAEYIYYAFYNHKKLLRDNTFYDSNAGECTIYYYFSSNKTDSVDKLSDKDFEIECIYFRSEVLFNKNEKFEIKKDSENHFLDNNKNSFYSKGIIYDNRYYYSLFIAEEKYMDIRISFKKDVSNTELNAVISTLLDSIVVV